MFFLSKKKYEINQANLSIVHYYCECHYESLNIFVIQNLYYSKFAFWNSLSKSQFKQKKKAWFKNCFSFIERRWEIKINKNSINHLRESIYERQLWREREAVAYSYPVLAKG